MNVSEYLQPELVKLLALGAAELHADYDGTPLSDTGEGGDVIIVTRPTWPEQRQQGTT